jgi:hypothetical protein
MSPAIERHDASFDVARPASQRDRLHALVPDDDPPFRLAA